MNYIDLLQELGRVRRSLEDLIVASSGAGTKELLRKRDAVTSAMERITESRQALGPLDATAVLATLDDLSTKLGNLPATTKSIPAATLLAARAIGTVADLLRGSNASPAGLQAPPQRPEEKDQLLSTATLPGATVAAPTTASGGLTFTAFCETHNIELPPPGVPIEEALQNESDHKAIDGNANDDVKIIVVK